jgi:hypothetical protein
MKRAARDKWRVIVMGLGRYLRIGCGAARFERIGTDGDAKPGYLFAAERPPPRARRSFRHAGPACIVGDMSGLKLGLTFSMIAALGGCKSGGQTGNAGSAGGSGPAGATAGTGSVGAAGTMAASGAGGTTATGAAGHGGASGAAATGTAGGDGGVVELPPTGPCAPPALADIYLPIDKLSLTGCMDPKTLTKFVSRAVPYEVNSPLWSDGATKTRAFVLPAGKKIHVRDCAANPGECLQGPADTGKWDFPVGSVMIKNFMFDDKFVETRLLMRVDDATWVGYGYEWNEAQTEATIAPPDRDPKTFNTGTRTVSWTFPSRMDCIKCHDAMGGSTGGSTLGPETAQMNRMVGGANQIDTFTTMNLFETPPAKPYKPALVAPYPGQAGSPLAGTSIDVEARSYMHANCSFCHRPQGQYPNFDSASTRPSPIERSATPPRRSPSRARRRRSSCRATRRIRRCGSARTSPSPTRAACRRSGRTSSTRPARSSSPTGSTRSRPARRRQRRA